MSRLFFVMGSESSGTVMMVQSFIRAGCQGEPEIRQSFDSLSYDRMAAPPRWGPLVVVRRSYPHGFGWPILSRYAEMARIVHQIDEVIPVVIRRDASCVIASKHKRGFGPRPQCAREVVIASQMIDEQLRAWDGLVVETIYERFVADAAERKRVFDLCGLPTPNLHLYDGNAKHRE